MTDICIITKLKDDRFQNLLRSIKEHTDEKTLNEVRLLVCYTGDDEEKMRDVQNSSPLKFGYIRDTYNFARNCNTLAKIGEIFSDKLLFINDDIELRTDAITHCVKILDDNPGIGTVGIKLLYPDGKIQHAGHLLLHKNCKFAGISHFLLKQNDRELHDILSVGNTGAFLLVRREDFDKVGGFDEQFNKCFEDVVFNWKILIQGKPNVTALSQCAVHYESTTRDRSVDKDDVRTMAEFFDNNAEDILKYSEILKPTVMEIR